MARSGSSSRTSSIGLIAVAGLADDLVALLLERLAQVHPDDGFVLGDHDTDRHDHFISLVSQVPSRRRPAGQLSSSSSWRCSSSAISAGDVGAVLAHRVEVLARLVRLVRRLRRLRHERPQRQLVGVVGELDELLVDHRQLVAQASAGASATCVRRRSVSQVPMDVPL